jgi:sulfate adenylyltransferase
MSLGGEKRKAPLDPGRLTLDDLQAALRDTRENAARVYDRVYGTFTALFDLRRSQQAPPAEEARLKAIGIQEELIQALEQKVEIALRVVEDPYMYQDRQEAERELEVARRILAELKSGTAADFAARVWNQRPYEDYRA